jgi:neutral ceramidase
MVKQFAAAAIEAHAALEPARIGFGAGLLEGASRNRHQDNDLIDPQVGVLRVERPDSREIIAILFNYTAHPVILGSDNLLLSGEFPGAAERAVEKTMGGVAIFTQGACGDVTINRSGDPWSEIERIGNLLAEEVVKTAKQIESRSELNKTVIFNVDAKLPGRVLPPLAQAEAELTRARTDYENAKNNDATREMLRSMEKRLRLLEGNVTRIKAVAEGKAENPAEIETEVQVFVLGDLFLVAVPGELFVEYALEMRRRIKEETGASMMLIGYANDYLGYIVTPYAIETGGYEAAVARVDASAGQLIVEAAVGAANIVGDLSKNPLGPNRDRP